MRVRVILFFLLLQAVAFSWDEFIQADLRVAIKRYTGSRVYFKGEKGDLYVEMGSGEDKLIYKIPEGKVGEIYIRNNRIVYNGKSTGVIRVYKGSYDSIVYLSTDKENYSPYRGDMEFIPYREKVLPVNSVQSEEYLYSVVPSEIGHYFPTEAIKAQVLAARTYLYYNLNNYKYEDFDLLDNVNSQMYLGKSRENEKINQLVNTTVGEIITYKGSPINALYYSTSGGRTANNEDVWGGAAVPYLRGKRDTASEAKSPRRQWSVSISKDELSKKAGFKVNSIKVLRVASNRVHTVELIGSHRKRMSGDDLRRMVGYNKLHSTQFKVADKGRSFAFTGRGSGHGVGMSQYGAYGLANSGKSYSQIVKHYYNGVEIKKLKND